MRMQRNTGWRLSLLVALLTLLALVVVACGGDATTTTKAPDTSATSATSATTETTAASTEPIKIGFAAGLTGNGAAAGQDFLNGVMLYVDQVNAAGGVLGRQIEIVSEDELNDPKNATTVAQKLVDAGVVAVIGHLTSGTTIPTLGIYAAAGIPQITPATNPDVTAQGIDSVFRVDPDDFAQGGNVGRYMFEKQGAKTAAIIHDKQAFGQGVAEQFQAAFEAAGGTVTSVNGITPGDVDFRAVLTKIKGEAPDMVYYGGVAAEGGLVIKQMRELGMEQKFIGPDQLFGPEFIKIGGTGAEGALVSFVAPPLDSTPELSKFLADYKAAYNEEPFVAQYGYDSILLIAEAIKAAGSTEGKDIAATLHAGTIKGILSDYSFEENGALAGGGVIHIYQVKDGADVWIDQTS